MGTFSPIPVLWDSLTNELVLSGYTSFSEFALAGTDGLLVDIRLLLEGAYAGSDTMSVPPSFLSNVPLSQPYGDASFDGARCRIRPNARHQCSS